MSTGIIFVYAPATFPNTPLENRMAFMHGTIRESKTRMNEIVFRVQDTKGEWEGYAEEKNTPMLNTGTTIRALGIITSQPDGRNVLACKWVKIIEKEENEFAERYTQKDWEKLSQEHAILNELKPHEMPKPKMVKTEEKIIKTMQKDENEFISAAEIKVEREYL